MTTPERNTDNPVIGTWRLISWEVKKADGRVYLPFGQDMDGYIAYAGHGSMSVFMRLLDKFVFYAGAYEIAGDRVTHHVRVADRRSTEGRDLVRTVQIDGNRMMLTTVEPPPRTLVENPEPGDTSRLTWERIK